jgi:phage gp36-like protein
VFEAVLVRCIVDQACYIATYLLRGERISSESIDVMKEEDLALPIDTQLSCDVSGQFTPQV